MQIRINIIRINIAFSVIQYNNAAIYNDPFLMFIYLLVRLDQFRI